MKAYHDLLNAILEKGTYKAAARENMPGTTSLFGYQFRHNLEEGFPLLTTKKMYWKGVVVELLWFLRGDTNIKYLLNNGVNIWNEDAFNFYTKKCKEQNITKPFTFEDFITAIKLSDSGYPNMIDVEKMDQTIPKDYILGDCGYQYGKVWRAWVKTDDVQNGYQIVDQIKNLIASLKSNPLGRRHIVSAWDPAHDSDLALTWCHAMFQFNCRPLTFEDREARFFASGQKWGVGVTDNDKAWKEHAMGTPKYYLDCQLYQRSADVFLGVPFNIASYALLTHLIAKICNMIPGEFIHTFGDVHIYENHMEAVKEQLTREPKKLPELEIMVNTRYRMGYDLEEIGFDKFIQSFSPDDFIIKDYEFHPAIKAELSTGMKK